MGFLLVPGDRGRGRCLELERTLIERGAHLVVVAVVARVTLHRDRFQHLLELAVDDVVHHAPKRPHRFLVHQTLAQGDRLDLIGEHLQGPLHHVECAVQLSGECLPLRFNDQLRGLLLATPWEQTRPEARPYLADLRRRSLRLRDQLRVIDDRRRDHEDDLAPLGGVLVPSERAPDNCQISQERDLAARRRTRLTEQTSQHDRLPIAHHHVRGDLVGDLVGDRHRRTRRVRRVADDGLGDLWLEFHPDHAVAGHERAEVQLRACIEELDRLCRGRLGRRGAEVAHLATDQHACRLTVERQDVRPGHDPGVRDLVEHSDEDGDVAGDEAEPGCPRTRTARQLCAHDVRTIAAGHRAGPVATKQRIDPLEQTADGNKVIEVHAAEDRDIDAPGVGLGQRRVQHDRLDQHLNGLGVELIDQARDRVHVLLPVHDDHRRSEGEVLAPAGRVRGHVEVLGLGVGCDRAVRREQRLNERRRVHRIQVVQADDLPLLDTVGVLEGLELFGGVDGDEVALLDVPVAVRVQDRVQRLIKRHAVQVGRHRRLDIFAGDDVLLGLDGQHLEHGGQIFVLDVKIHDHVGDLDLARESVTHVNRIPEVPWGLRRGSDTSDLSPARRGSRQEAQRQGAPGLFGPRDSAVLTNPVLSITHDVSSFELH